MVDIIYEDKAIIVCHKSAGMAVQTARAGEKDMVSELKNYLVRERKSEPYIGIVHRLDQPVEGLILFAKDTRSAAVLSKQVQQGGGMHKEYLARIYGRLPEDKNTLEDWMVRDKGNMSRIANATDAGAQKAVLEYEKLEDAPDTELIKILLHSGRHHQIRLQLSAHGTPILGDSRYGSEDSVTYAREHGIKRLCLIARKLEFDHPLNGERKCFELDVIL